MAKLLSRFWYCALLAPISALILILCTLELSTKSLSLRSAHLTEREIQPAREDVEPWQNNTDSQLLFTRAGQQGDDGDVDMDESSSEVTESTSSDGSIDSNDPRVPPVVPQPLFTYDEYVAKGRTLCLYMSQDIRQVDSDMRSRGKMSPGALSVQSIWQCYEHDPRNNGWKRLAAVTVNFSPVGWAPIKTALDALGVSTVFRSDTPHRQPGNLAIQYVQDGDYTVGNERYRGTGAEYSNIYNVYDGVVIAYDNYGPQYKINTVAKLRYENHRSGIEPPLLRQWSDIVWLEYRKQCLNQERRLSDLRFVFRVEAIAKGTLRVLNTILDPKGDTERGVTRPNVLPARAQKWDHRRTFHEGQPQFQAIVGSPNGAGVAWLLITHKAELGNKKIRSVTIFRSDKDEVNHAPVKGPSLLFELADAPLLSGPEIPENPRYMAPVGGTPGKDTMQKPSYRHHEKGA